jgi:hypothetical protein
MLSAWKSSEEESAMSTSDTTTGRNAIRTDRHGNVMVRSPALAKALLGSGAAPRGNAGPGKPHGPTPTIITGV